MSTKTAKIEDILNVRKWNGQNGVVYYFDILLDNHDRGSIGKKSKESLKVGDTLVYLLEEGEKGNKIKEFKENGFSGGFQGNRGATRGGNESFALSYAKDIVVAMIAKKATLDKTPAELAEYTMTMADKFKHWLDEHK